MKNGLVTFSCIWLLKALQNSSARRLFSEQSLDITKGVEKRILAIGRVENDLDKKPLTRQGRFYGSSKKSKMIFKLIFGV